MKGCLDSQYAQINLKMVWLQRLWICQSSGLEKIGFIVQDSRPFYLWNWKDQMNIKIILALVSNMAQ
jgi:hypothetical protein